MSDQNNFDAGEGPVSGAHVTHSASASQAAAGTGQPNAFPRGLESMTAALDAETGKPEKDKKKTTKLKLEIAHQTHGRVRMKVPSAKGDPEALRQIADAFGVIPGIERVTVNATTGSVVLHYDTDHHAAFNERLSQRFLSENQSRPPANEIDDFARKIQGQAEFLASHSETARAVVDFLKNLDQDIKTATNNLIDFKLLLAAGIIAFTVTEVGATAATPVWLTLVMFSLNHVIELRSPHGQEAPATAPVVFKNA